MCNSDMIKYIVLLFKYIIPIMIVLLGLIKLIILKNKKKAFKKFLIYILSGSVVFILTFIIEFVLKNESDCIRCIMENNCKEEVKQEYDNNELDISQKVENQIDSNDDVPQVVVLDGVTYVNGILIVNKTYALPEDYAPTGAQGYERCNECITKETLNAFNEMKADAESLGLNIYISSGYRSYSYQDVLYNRYVNNDGKELADKYSARAGHSEHQTGLSFDLNTIDDLFANTAEGKWVQDNCYRYGLILRYPKGKENFTGYQYESWHLRYVGVELASELYNNGNWITLEEYFNLTSEYE